MDLKVCSTTTFHCHQKPKAYQSSKGISFQDIDSLKNKSAGIERVPITCQMSEPVIVIDGEVIVCFD